MLASNHAGEPSGAESASGGILLIGETLFDLMPDGEAIAGGAPFNVARNLAALGHTPWLVTRLGSDGQGDRLLEQLRGWGMPEAGVQRDAHRPTGFAAVEIDATGPRFVLGPDQAWDALDASEAAALVARVKPALVYFGTLAQRSACSRSAVRKVLHEARALRFLDLNLREGPDNRQISEESLHLADWVKVNDVELAEILAWFVHQRGAGVWGSPGHQEAVAKLIETFRIERLFVTRGADGYAVFDSRGVLVASGGAPSVTVVDSVGAGDAFSAVTLAGRLNGWPLEPTMRRAADFAASVCTLQGAVTRDTGFYAGWRQRWSGGFTEGGAPADAGTLS